MTYCIFRLLPILYLQVTGTSVSSSVTSSSSVNEAGKSQRLSPSELLRQRLKLYSQKRRLFL